MDEILKQPHAPRHEGFSAGLAAAAALPRQMRESALERTERFLQEKFHVVRRADAVLAWFRSFPPIMFLAIATVLGLTAVVSTVYVPTYQVVLDGQPIGVVAHKADFDAAVSRVEARATDILGHEYVMDGEVTYRFALTERDAVPSAYALEPYLLDRIGDVMKSYVLSVNGQVVGAAEDKSTLTGILDTIQAAYTDENTVSAQFVDHVNITREYISANVEQDVAAIQATLTSNTNGETTYEVQAGDTFMALALDNGMTMRELEALNPGVDVNTLMIGQVLNIKEEIPFLSVQTVDTVTYIESIAAPVREVEDSSMYKGDSKVLSAGSAGSQQVTANVTSVNGSETAREITSTTVLTQPTEKVVAVGTKERPSWMPKGYLIWPVSGRVTSSYGYRSIFSSYSFHRGLDIAVPYGTSVVASDGGTVTYAGWQGTYGKLVIIDHGDGRQTYYAHNSSLLVNVGDKVYQGQTIARAGSTGRSTGSHCHFEVHVNGSLVNPYNYLP